MEGGRGRGEEGGSRREEVKIEGGRGEGGREGDGWREGGRGALGLPAAPPGLACGWWMVSLAHLGGQVRALAGNEANDSRL